MTWVTESNIEEYLNILSNPPIETITDSYSEFVTVSIGDTEIQTTIVSSQNWIHLEEQPDININDTVKTDVDDEALLSIAQLMAFQQDGKQSITSEEISDYMWNGETYILSESVDFDTPLTELSIQESDFYSVISHTSRLLGDSLTDRPPARSSRNKLFNTTGDLARNIDKFYRPLGGTFLTVVLDDDGTYYLLVGERSERVVLWPNLLTAFPAGYFKPTDVTYGTEIEKQMLSEYSREAMDTEEKRADDESKGVHAISQLFRADKAQFAVTGFGIESTTVAGELTGVLLIEYPEYTTYLFNNLENSYDISHINALPIKEDLESKFKSLLQSEKITPQTAFAIGSGLQYLDEETDIDVPFDVSTTIKR